jgi:putative ABC transport system permease protein
VGVSVADERTADALAARLKTVLPVASWFTVSAADEPGVFAGGRPKGAIAHTVLPSCMTQNGVMVGTLGTVTVSCGFRAPSAFAGAAIGGADLLKELTGISDPRAAAVLDQGGAVVFDPNLVHDGKVTFSVTSFESADPAANADRASTTDFTPAAKNIDLPAVYVDPHGGPIPPYLVSPAGAKKLGVSGGRESLILTLDHHITSAELQRANRVLAEDGIDTGLAVENGYQSKLGAANLATLAVAVLVAIGAAAIATGLALADGQPDLETLAAVGGSPATRRMLAGSTALVVTGLGSLIGVPVGFAIADGLVRLRDDGFAAAYALGNSPPSLGQSPALGQSTPFVVPWLNIVVAVVAVPVVTALGAALLTRSRLQLTRRIT